MVAKKAMAGDRCRQMSMRKWDLRGPTSRFDAPKWVLIEISGVFRVVLVWTGLRERARCGLSGTYFRG